VVDPEWGERVDARLNQLEATLARYEAATAKLTGRVGELEGEVEAMNVRLKAVERATPLKRPETGPPVKTKPKRNGKPAGPLRG
jgi:uncharacterized coiled-coil protein SlyX